MHTEDKLRSSLREINDLKAALDEHAIVAITNPQGKITCVNDKFCAISQYSRDELIGKDHRIINSGHHPAAFIRKLWRTIADGKVWHGEIKNKAKDGTFYWVDTTIVPFLDEKGRPRQYVAIRTDITERRAAELAASRLAAIVESSDDAIVGKDLQGIITSWNRGAEKIFGYTSAEMVGTPIMRLIPPDRHHEEEKILEQIKLGRKVDHFETLRQTKNGQVINVSVTSSPIKDGSGKIVGASKVARDITESKKAEQKINQLNAELELRVAQRTAELEQANQEMEAFSYSISHDLRAPLRAMGGFAHILETENTGRLSPAALHAIGRIRENAVKMGNLIDGLLEFASLGRRSVTKRTVNPASIARAVADDLKPETADRNVEIEISKLPGCKADAVLLKQVFVNLLSNALKYSRDRNPAKIEVGWLKEKGETVYYVRDNGAGFDMEYANKLFRVFQRLHRADEFEGTGVGLAIVQRIINRHGGRVWAEARVGKGATFYFTLGTHE